jgi:hypothetical protein
LIEIMLDADPNYDSHRVLVERTGWRGAGSHVVLLGLASDDRLYWERGRVSQSAIDRQTFVQLTYSIELFVVEHRVPSEMRLEIDESNARGNRVADMRDPGLFCLTSEVASASERPAEGQIAIILGGTALSPIAICTTTQ